VGVSIACCAPACLPTVLVAADADHRRPVLPTVVRAGS
jgi:hypothetical protein